MYLRKIYDQNIFCKKGMKRNQKGNLNLQCNMVKTKHLPKHQSTRDDLPLLFKISFISSVSLYNTRPPITTRSQTLETFPFPKTHACKKPCAPSTSFFHGGWLEMILIFEIFLSSLHC